MPYPQPHNQSAKLVTVRLAETFNHGQVIMIHLRCLDETPYLAYCKICLNRLDETPYLAYCTNEINLDNSPRVTSVALDTPTHLASSRTNNTVLPP